MSTGGIYKPFSQFSEIQITLEQFRRQLLLLDSAASASVLGAYSDVNRNLDGRVRELVSTMQKRKMSGASIKELLRYRLVTRFRNQFWIPELYSYLSILANQLKINQAKALALAEKAAFEAVAAGLPKGVTPEMLARMGIEWNRVPPQAMANIVASTEASAPVGRIIGRLGQEVAEEVMFNLVQGIALGKGPRETAKLVTESAGMGLSKALTLTRTETMRAYREASRMQYQANPAMVKGYRRMSAKDERVCIACLVLDGEFYELDEPLQAHPNCRCTLVPETLTYQDLGLQDIPMPEPGDNGREWFRKQPRNVQLQIMGKSETRLGAWERGDVDFGDMFQVTDHPVWGKSASVKPLRSMGLDPADYRRHKNTRWICQSPCEEVTLTPYEKAKIDELEGRPFVNEEDILVYRDIIGADESISLTKLDNFGPKELDPSMPQALREHNERLIDQAISELQVSHNTHADNLIATLNDEVMMPPGLEQWREQLHPATHKFDPTIPVTELQAEALRDNIGTGLARAIEESHMVYGRGVSTSFQRQGSSGVTNFGDVRVRMKDDVLSRSIFYDQDVGLHWSQNAGPALDIPGMDFWGDLSVDEIAEFREELGSMIDPRRVHGDLAKEAMRRRWNRYANFRYEQSVGRGFGRTVSPRPGFERFTIDDLYQDMDEVFGQTEMRIYGGIDISEIDAIILEKQYFDDGDYDDLFSLASAKKVKVEVQTSPQFTAIYGEAIEIPDEVASRFARDIAMLDEEFKAVEAAMEGIGDEFPLTDALLEDIRNEGMSLTPSQIGELHAMERDKDLFEDIPALREALDNQAEEWIMEGLVPEGAVPARRGGR